MSKPSAWCYHAAQRSKPQRAKWQRCAVPASRRIDIDQFEAPSAQSADYAVRLRKCADYAVCAGHGFLLAAHAACAFLPQKPTTMRAK